MELVAQLSERLPEDDKGDSPIGAWVGCVDNLSLACELQEAGADILSCEVIQIASHVFGRPFSFLCYEAGANGRRCPLTQQ